MYILETVLFENGFKFNKILNYWKIAKFGAESYKPANTTAVLNKLDDVGDTTSGVLSINCSGNQHLFPHNRAMLMRIC